MRLTIENYPLPRDFAWIKRAFEVCSRELGLEEYPNELVVRVVRGLDTGRPARGHVLSELGPRGELYMELEENPCACGKEECSMLNTFCHEMVHVRQVASGELAVERERGGGETVTRWRGRRFPRAIEFIAMVTNGDQELLPWEKEPYERMYDLAKLCSSN
jgi:hypothetical protein